MNDLVEFIEKVLTGYEGGECPDAISCPIPVNDCHQCWVDYAVKGLSERGCVRLAEDQTHPSVVCAGQEPHSVYDSTIKMMEYYDFKRITPLTEVKE